MISLHTGFHVEDQLEKLSHELAMAAIDSSDSEDEELGDNLGDKKDKKKKKNKKKKNKNGKLDLLSADMKKLSAVKGKKNKNHKNKNGKHQDIKSDDDDDDDDEKMFKSELKYDSEKLKSRLKLSNSGQVSPFLTGSDGNNFSVKSLSLEGSLRITDSDYLLDVQEKGFYNESKSFDQKHTVSSMNTNFSYEGYGSFSPLSPSSLNGKSSSLYPNNSKSSSLYPNNSKSSSLYVNNSKSYAQSSLHGSLNESSSLHNSSNQNPFSNSGSTTKRRPRTKSRYNSSFTPPNNNNNGFGSYNSPSSYNAYMYYDNPGSQSQQSGSYNMQNVPYSSPYAGYDKSYIDANYFSSKPNSFTNGNSKTGRRGSGRKSRTKKSKLKFSQKNNSTKKNSSSEEVQKDVKKMSSLDDITEEELVALAEKILSSHGSVPVGKMGSLLHRLANNHNLPSLLKERYGGLKKFLQNHDEEFVLANDHPYNPHVYLKNGKVPVKSQANKTKTSSVKRKKSHRSRSMKDRYNPKFLTSVLSLDCEFVGGSMSQDILARVSIVNYSGEIVYDKYVKPSSEVVDYRTHVSGVTSAHLENGTDFKTVRNEVSQLIANRILVGHGLESDFKVLELQHPGHLIRDTAYFKPLCPLKPKSLKSLCQTHLGIKIQKGEHCSVEDSRAVLKIYKKFSLLWEQS